MSTTQRKQILEGIAKRIDLFFGPGGKVSPVLREVKQKPWRPGSSLRPRATVSDMGCKKMNEGSEAGKMRTLAWQVIIDLPQNWDEADFDWAIHIERMVMALQNFSPGAAATRTDVLSDDPMEVILQDVASESVWVIEGETDFYQVFCNFQDNEETMLTATRGLT